MVFPACAQVAGSIDIESDYRVRGYSFSAGRPTLTAQLSYDDDSGIYLNVSATGELGRDDPIFLGAQGNIGYVRRLTRTLSIDGGIVRTQYRSGYRGGLDHNYTEAHLGLADGPITARIHVSPDYYRRDVWTLYSEVDGVISPVKNWRISGHVGGFAYLSTPPGYTRSRQAKYDWRLGLSRQFGAFDLHAAVSGGGPGREYYAGSFRGRTALTAGASWSF